MGRLAMSNLGIFILVGTCMLIASAIANHRKGDFLPRTREDRFIVAFLVAVIAGIIALVFTPYSHTARLRRRPQLREHRNQ
jgi:Na+/melibiose symporter-like transporter